MFKRGTNTRQTDGSTELGQQSRVESGDARTQGRPGESRPVDSDRAESNPVESRPLESPVAQERPVERTREVPVATAPVGHDEVVARGKEQYGGIKIGSAFFGWLTATGMAVLLVALLAAAGTAVGVSNGTSVGQATDQASKGSSTAQTVGLVGGIALLVVLFVAYAGRGPWAPSPHRTGMPYSIPPPGAGPRWRPLRPRRTPRTVPNRAGRAVPATTSTCPPPRSRGARPR